MSYKTILTQVEPDWGSDLALEAAIQIAGMFSAHLVGVGAEEFQAAAYAVGDGTLVELAREQIETDPEIRRGAIPQGRGGRPCLGFDLDIGALGARRGRDRAGLRADLIVARRAPQGSSAQSICPTAQLILGSAAPVLLAPNEPTRFSGKRVLVAWRDGREARRALIDAMPFLRQAEHVMLATVCPDAGKDEAETQLKQVAQRLLRHRVNVGLDVIPTGPADAAGKLVEAAYRMQADLVVAGAYSHSRLQEWVLGGVTQYLLDGCSQYVLFSH